MTPRHAARLWIDRRRCEGHGLCVDAAPTLIALDDDAAPVLLVADGSVPPGTEERASAAVAVCPLAALHLRTGPVTP